MQKGMRLNDGHVAYLGLLAKKDGSRRGYLSKRSGDNTKWQSKWFALLQNMLFCFESDSSSRPSGLYLLEGSACDRAPSLPAKDSLEKQVGAARGAGRPVRGLPRAAPTFPYIMGNQPGLIRQILAMQRGPPMDAERKRLFRSPLGPQRESSSCCVGRPKPRFCR
uniref:PH domain-containing protein n=1 Tax=Gopherus agassizii TaxID=38772 RepID=A0A452H197_9SAUR